MGNGSQTLSVEYFLMVQILRDSQRPRWVVEHHCCPRWLGSRQERVRDQGLFLNLVLHLWLHQPPSQRTSCSTDSSPTSSMLSTSPNLREHLFLHVHLQDRTLDHRRRHPRRQGLPIARFYFVGALCIANFNSTVTWKQNGNAIVVGDQSSAVKRFILVKKIKVLQAASASLWLPWEVAEREKQLSQKKIGTNLHMNTPLRLDL